MPTQLIINADDFGYSHEVNSAVQRAYRKGILTSASLMVSGHAVKDAIEIAKSNPDLAVGLHLVLSHGKSMLACDQVPDLVDKSSHFASSPAVAGLRYFFSARVKRQLRMEIEAQFEAFARTGLRLSHVDGHQHLHAHPAVLPTVIELANKYGAAGIRMPNDPFRANLRVDRLNTLSKLGIALGHAVLTAACRLKLPKSGLAYCDASIGVYRSGSMSDVYIIYMLKQLKYGSIEFFFHPADIPIGAPPLEDNGPNSGDLAALISPRLRAYMDANRYERTTYPGLRAAHGSS